MALIEVYAIMADGPTQGTRTKKGKIPPDSQLEANFFCCFSFLPPLPLPSAQAVSAELPQPKPKDKRQRKATSS